MKKVFIMMCFLFIALVGCNTQNQHQNMQNDAMPKAVKVDVKTNPQAIQPNEKVEIQAIVTQDGKPVDDAQDVKFETWKDGDQKHDMTIAKHKENGVYSTEMVFGQEGVYHIIAHTDARDMHVMPEVKVAVGNAKVTQ